MALGSDTLPSGDGYKKRRARGLANGKAAEEELLAILKKRGRRVTPYEDIHHHIDIEILFSDDKWHSVDVKAMDYSGKKQSDEIYLELKNVQGKLGWLLGKAEYIAFGMFEYWIFVDRKSLVAHVHRKCGSTKAGVNHSPTPCRYKYYTREGRDDLVTIISLEDLMFLKPEFIIPRKKGFK